jgi:aminopeptidase N
MQLSNHLHTIKQLCIIAIIIAMSGLTSCRFESDLDNDITSQGVSKKLADMRKALISDLSYDLTFIIPSELDSCVTGKTTITMSLKEKERVVIDFKADNNNLRSLTVNGKNISDYNINNEHIIISDKYLRAGKNQVVIRFVAGEQSLNRNSEYLYTLLVPDRARTLFPCFDQPNLKATYNLTLEVPQKWVAVSNTTIKSETNTKGERKIVKFAPTEPLSTYLFSFVAGKFARQTRTDGKRSISAYFRETDPKKLLQLNTIFDQIFAALDWLEEYTGINYPFAKYDFIILPGFQFGGMEHTGATLYNDRMMFFGEYPTIDEQLMRSQIIAHETAHMWFGDYVTMDWFDDVWTKEVFANYFASIITEPMYPDINHQLYRQRTFAALALAEDRTEGATAIQQPLTNLQDAGLIYNNIIYNKAPVMMFKLVELMGEDAFKEGIREYLNKFAYGNATWDDLITILDEKTDKDLDQFSEVWVKAPGMPTITTAKDDKGFTITQTDPQGRGLIWPQTFTVKALLSDRVEDIKINMADNTQRYVLMSHPVALLPNTDGKGYGFFLPDDESLSYIISHWADLDDELARQSLVMTLLECYYHGKISAEHILQSLIDGVKRESNELIAASIIKNIAYICGYTSGNLRQRTEQQLAELAATLPSPTLQLTADRQLFSIATDKQIIADLYDHWSKRDKDNWSSEDYTTLALELAIRMSAQADAIIKQQRTQITNADRLRSFDFVSRACTSDTVKLDKLFNSLKSAKNRRIQPDAERLLYYLNHPTRDAYSVKYIRPALEMLQEIQRTGDIFFPSRWAYFLLCGHHSKAARNEVDRFLNDNPDYPQLLKNKILQAAYSPG